jgi:hypothetical protein
VIYIAGGIRGRWKICGDLRSVDIVGDVMEEYRDVCRGRCRERCRDIYIQCLYQSVEQCARGMSPSMPMPMPVSRGMSLYIYIMSATISPTMGMGDLPVHANADADVEPAANVHATVNAATIINQRRPPHRSPCRDPQPLGIKGVPP